jgi:hypothetical protein
MDDPYPVDGSTFYIPPESEETKQAKEDEKLVTAQAAPYLQSLIDWFDAQITATDSVSLVVLISKTKGVSLETAIASVEVIKDLLTDKKAEFMNLKLNLPE